MFAVHEGCCATVRTVVGSVSLHCDKEQAVQILAGVSAFSALTLLVGHQE